MFRLTGEHVIDRHTASHSMPLMDMRTLAWSDALGSELAPERMLPRLGWSDETAGTVTAEAARATGLRPGTPVGRVLAVGGGTRGAVWPQIVTHAALYDERYALYRELYQQSRAVVHRLE